MPQYAILIPIILITLIVLGPLATIWALNTLFTLSIGYTLETWLAVFILQSLIYEIVKISK